MLLFEEEEHFCSVSLFTAADLFKYEIKNVLR